LALSAGCCPTQRAWAHRATTVAAETLLVADMSQTRWMAEQPCGDGAGQYTEANPLLPRCPTKRDVTVYVGAWMVAVGAGHAVLPRWASWTLSGAVLAVEAWTVRDNRYVEGMQFGW
jgi:hypothetical protein